MNYKKTIPAALLLLSLNLLYAQKPTDAPKTQSEPVDFTRIENIVIYILIPVLFIILYFVWRSRKRKEAATAAREE